MADAYYRGTRRRVFPPGTTTEELRFTTTASEAVELRKKCKLHDTSLSELVVRAALATNRSLTEREKAALMHELIQARKDIGQLAMALRKATDAGTLHADIGEPMVASLKTLSDRLFHATEGLV